MRALFRLNFILTKAKGQLPFETDVIASVWFKSAITAASESDRVRPTGCDVVGVDVPLVSLGESDDACVVRTGALKTGFLNSTKKFWKKFFDS